MFPERYAAGYEGRVGAECSQGQASVTTAGMMVRQWTDRTRLATHTISPALASAFDLPQEVGSLPALYREKRLQRHLGSYREADP